MTERDAGQMREELAMAVANRHCSLERFHRQIRTIAHRAHLSREQVRKDVMADVDLILNGYPDGR